MIRLLFTVLFTYSLFSSYSQEGDFFVSQFSPTFGQEDQIYFDLKFTQNDELIAANRSGIVRFDGTDWSLILTPSAPLSVALDEKMNLYVACASDFGRVVIDKGSFVFESLAPLPTDKVFTKQVILVDGRVFFLQENRVFSYDTRSAEVTYFDSDSVSGSFVYMFPYEEQLRISALTSSFALFDSLMPVKPILPDSAVIVGHSINEQTRQEVLATLDGSLYLVGDVPRKIEVFEGKAVNDLNWVSEDLLAVSTFSEGVFFYNVSSDEVVAATNAGNGLPDNEVFAIATDHAAGVWVANSFGFSRIAPLLPIKSFNHYPGLSGNLITAIYKDQTWHLATSDGVYFFDELNNYKNIVYYVPRTSQSKQVTKNQQVSRQPTSGSQKVQDSKSRLGILRRNNKNEDKVLLQREESTQPKVLQLKNNVTKFIQKGSNKAGELISRIKLPITDIKKVKYDRKVRKELVSTQYFYEKIPDVSEKIKQLIAFDKAIIAVTPTGIIEIRNQIAEEIFSEPVRYVYRPEGEQALWVSTQAGTIYKLEEVGDVWLETQTLESLGDIILSMYSDSSNQMWMAGANRLIKLNVSDTALVIENELDIENQFFDHIRLTRINNQLALINTQGVFLLDEVSDKIRKAPDLNSRIGTITKHLQQSDGRVWVHNGTNWQRIEPDAALTSYTYLKLFPEMSYVDQKGEEIWLINDFNSLFKFIPSETDSIPNSQMFIREIKDGAGLVNSKDQKLKISYENNSVFVELARPDYMGLSNVQFSYKMVGLSDQWSEWTNNNKLAFNYLPAGQYRLHVKSVDALGREQSIVPVEIKITPPYWQTTWFSALQVVFFAALVFIASRVNRTSTQSRKQLLISNLLTIVTIVMVIELLQNIAESYFGDAGSPVLAFGLDVVVALLIFPVELLLRRVVTGNKSSMAPSLD